LDENQQFSDDDADDQAASLFCLILIGRLFWLVGSYSGIGVIPQS